MVSLTPEQIKRKQYLLSLLQSRQLSVADAEELRQLLEKERQEATSLGDVIAALALLFLIGLVIAYLADDR